MTALHTPCHTQDSICFFMEDGDDRVVFTGDTLFIAGKQTCFASYCYHCPLGSIGIWVVGEADLCVLGCGRFFEGNAEEMHTALNKVLASLPDDTKVYVRSVPFLFFLVRLTGTNGS